MGGCATALYQIMHNKKAGIVFVCAYTVVGFIFGVVTLAILTIYDHGPVSMSELILFSIMGGASGSFGLATSNYTIRAVFRKFGMDIQVTIRRDKYEERRDCSK